MAKIIEARVIQKIDTEQGWNANESILYKGEVALVGDTDRVYNIKVGNGFKKFRDLPYMVDYISGLYTGVVTPQSQVPSGVNNVFLVSEQGTYTNFGGVILPKDNLGIIYKNGNNFTIQLIPIVSEEKLQEYIDEKLVDINVGFGGEISTLNQSPNVQGMYIPKISGVYPNFGNLEYNPVEGFTLFLYKDNQFSKVVVPLNAVEGDVNFNNNALGVSGSAVEKYAVKKINTIADLRNTQGEYDGQIIELLGYYETGDKETALYKFTINILTDDGGKYINTNAGTWELQIDKEWIKVAHYGIFPNKTNDSDVLFCSNQLKKMVQSNIKCLFCSGDYYIRDIEFTTKVLVFIKGQSNRKYRNSTSTRILTQGGNFMVFNFTEETFVYTYNMIYVSVDSQGSCFEKIQLTGDADFSVMGNSIVISNFEKGIYTPSWGTGFLIEDAVIQNNKYGIYAGKEANIARLVKINFLANQYGLKIAGENVLVEQLQVSLNYPRLQEGEKCIGIEMGSGTINGLYNEEYTGSAELTPETHVLIKHSLYYTPTDNDGVLVLKNIQFPLGDSVAHIEMGMPTSYLKPNSIKVIADIPRQVPRIITTGTLKKLVRGIEVNGNNFTKAIPSNEIYKTTQYYNYPEVKVLAPFRTYTSSTYNEIKVSRIDIESENIKGFELFINTDNTSSGVPNQIYDSLRKGIRPEVNTPYILEYDLKFKSSTNELICLVLCQNTLHEVLEYVSPIEIASGVYEYRFKGSVIRKAGNTTPYIVSLGFNKAYKVPTLEDLTSFTGFYHLRSFSENSSYMNRNGLIY